MSSAQEEPLDQRLVQVTLRMLAEDGLEDLSLRRIARHAGVSHGAPLRHFRSLADLLSEVAACGFRLLSEAMQKAVADLPADAPALLRLHAAWVGYARLAGANPGLFALMFRPEDLDVANESFRRDSIDAFEGLVGCVAAAQADGWNATLDTRVLAGSVWSAVHGLATLWAQGAMSAVVPNADFDDMITTTAELVLHDRQRSPS